MFNSDKILRNLVVMCLRRMLRRSCVVGVSLLVVVEWAKPFSDEDA
jgi:hypothetical protein